MTHHHVARDEWEAVAPVLCAISYDEADPAQWMNVCVSASRRHWAGPGVNTTVELLGGPATDTDTIHLNPRSVAAGLDLARCHGHATVVGNDHDITITSGPVTLTIGARGLENDPGLIPPTSGPTTVARLCAGDLAATILTAWVHPRGTDPSRPTPQSVLAIRDQTVEIRTDWDDHLLGVTTVAADATTTGIAAEAHVVLDDLFRLLSTLDPEDHVTLAIPVSGHGSLRLETPNFTALSRLIDTSALRWTTEAIAAIERARLPHHCYAPGRWTLDHADADLGVMLLDGPPAILRVHEILAGDLEPTIGVFAEINELNHRFTSKHLSLDDDLLLVSIDIPCELLGQVDLRAVVDDLHSLDGLGELVASLGRTLRPHPRQATPD